MVVSIVDYSFTHYIKLFVHKKCNIKRSSGKFIDEKSSFKCILNFIT